LLDKAQWQYDSALEAYCEQTGIDAQDLTEEDENQVWEYAGNHIAYFITWLIRREMLSDLHAENSEDIETVKSREMTGAQYAELNCDWVLAREDLSEKVKPFVDAYYRQQYIEDYTFTLDRPALSGVFSWAEYDRVEYVLDRAYRYFKRTGKV